MKQDDYILGISSHFHDSAAALVQGTRIVAAAQEERFSRRKADWRYPDAAIAYCLSQLPAGITPAAVAYYENPNLKADRILQSARANAPRGARLWPQMLNTLKSLSNELPAQLKATADDEDRIFFLPHHASHAASAFYPSPFKEAAVLVADGVGEWSTTTIWHGSAKGLCPVAEIRFPHSLGLFYSAFTQYCGFKVNSGEYKLMGLASFGAPRFFDEICANLIDLKEDGSFNLDMSYFDFDKGLSSISPLFEMLFQQPPRASDAPVTAHYMNVAASAQAVLEEALLRLARTALARTGQRNLCMAGGVALNCRANRRIRQGLQALEGIWIQPAAGDAGGALGAALELAHLRLPAPRACTGRDDMSDGLLGPAYSDPEIRAALNNAGLVFETAADAAELARLTAEALSDKQIVGHFDGRAEFGPRALGNRSILADPRGNETQTRVNRRIKFREDWRPFAPIVMAEEAARIFEPPVDSPYMLYVSDLKSEFRGPCTLGDARARGLFKPMELQNAITSNFNAVTHVDFSARIQTLAPDAKSRARSILAAFRDLTGCPMLLNTSFNVRGEPIVGSPVDAINCFLNTHLDLLVIGSFLVRRTAQGSWVKRKIGRKTFVAD